MERRPRVLVVEDSATMRGYVSAALEAEGRFSVVTVASAFDALRLLPREHFDLLITDINMPDISGLELIRFVRDSPSHAGLPLIIISTDGAERDRDRGLRLGANAYLVKPFPPETLVELASRTVGA